MNTEDKLQRKADNVKVINWLAKSDIYISREQMARYSGVDLQLVNDLFEHLENNGVIQYQQSSKYGVVYKQNKQVIQKMIEHIKEWETVE